VTVLHPRHKLSYFKAANWEDEWIDAAERIVRAEFEHSYANRGLDTDDEESAATEDNASTDVVRPSRCCWVLLTTLALILLGSVFEYL
jgi:hypothetical protein